MLYIISVILGSVLGILAGGRLSGLMDLRFKKTWLIISAVLVQLAVSLADNRTAGKYGSLAFLLSTAAFLPLIGGFWFNRRYTGIIAAGIGCLLNGLVIILNGGKMPVDAAAPGLAGGVDPRHSIINESTRLAFLSDVIYPPGILGAGMRVVSAGDLAIAAGLAILAFELTTERKSLFGGD